MLEELDQFVLTEDFPEEGLEAGEVGTIVMVYEDPPGYHGEFTYLDGRTRAVVTLSPAQVRPVRESDVAKVSV